MTRRRAVVAFLLMVLAGLGVQLVLPSAASAHAVLVSSTPGDGVRLTAAPSAVTLRFNERVTVGAGYVRVLQAGGQRVDAGDPSVSDTTISLPLRTGLRDASYTVTYRVVSADSHPVSGAWTFVVGDGQLVPAGAAGTSGGSPIVTSGLSAARWIGFAGLALGVGVPVLLATCWPAGWAEPRTRRLTAAGLAATALSGVLGIALQGPYAAGSGLGSVADPALLSSTLGSLAGVLLALRVVLAAGLAAVLVSGWRRGSTPAAPLLAAAGVLALGLVLTTAGIGHAAAGSWTGLALAVTAVHVAAMSVWFGGLVVLLAVLLRRGADPASALEVLPRWSRVAFGSVVALVVSGVVQSVREVGSVAALVSTTYGWTLVAKLALVIVLIGAAGVSRAWVQDRLGTSRRRVTAHAFAATSATRVPARSRAATGDDVRQLRRSVLLEVAVGAVVLALSAVLVGTAPADTATAAAAQPVDVLVPLQGSSGASGNVEISVSPAQVGANTLHVTLLDAAGQLAQPRDIGVSITERAQQIGPLTVPLEPAGPGHWTTEAMDVPATGTWTVTVNVRVDEFTATTASTDVRVG